MRERETGAHHLTRDGSASSAKWQRQICEVLEGSLIRVSESVKHKYTSRLLKAGESSVLLHADRVERPGIRKSFHA